MQLKQTKLTNIKITERNIATILEKGVLCQAKKSNSGDWSGNGNFVLYFTNNKKGKLLFSFLMYFFSINRAKKKILQELGAQLR